MEMPYMYTYSRLVKLTLDSQFATQVAKADSRKIIVHKSSLFAGDLTQEVCYHLLQITISLASGD